MTYRITGLDPAPFGPLFALLEQELAERAMVRITVDRKPGFPCRVSLIDRELGEQVILLNHVSHDVANPYRASHAIFVAEHGRQAEYIDRVPPVFETRMLSLRGFGGDGMMVDASVTGPGAADEGIRALLANPDIATIHAHNAARGCFSARIERI